MAQQIHEENWEELLEILVEPFDDELENENTPEFTAVKFCNNDVHENANTCDTGTCTISSAEASEKYDNEKDGHTIPGFNNKQEITDTDSDSDMNIPLADLIERKRMKTKRSLFEPNFSASESDFDDEVNDPTFKVRKKDLNRLDSDTDSFEGRKQG